MKVEETALGAALNVASTRSRNGRVQESEIEAISSFKGRFRSLIVIPLIR
jgi:hypothetical protein